MKHVIFDLKSRRARLHANRLSLAADVTEREQSLADAKAKQAAAEAEIIELTDAITKLEA